MSITSYPQLIGMGGGVGYYPYFVQVSRGLVNGHKRIFKFGHNPEIQDVEETIWDGGGIYTYPSSAVAMTVTSGAGATDNGVQVNVAGLDGDYNEVNETVTLAGSGTATTTQTFLRVNRCFIAGSTAPTDDVTVANGGTTYAQITNGENQTLMTVWTVPAGYTAYLLALDATAFTEQNNKVATMRYLTRELNGVFRVKNKFDLFQAAFHQNYITPEPILEKTDIEFRAVATSSNADLRVAASMDILYIEN
jgi:hypothetical protein